MLMLLAWLASYDALRSALLKASPPLYDVVIGHAVTSDVTDTRRYGNRFMLLLLVQTAVVLLVLTTPDKLAVLVYKCLRGLAPSYLADELHRPAYSQSFEGVCVPLRLMNSLFPVPDSQPSFSSGRCTDLKVFRSISHMFRDFPFSAVA